MCLTESISNEAVLANFFASKSPSVGWQVLNVWFLPKSFGQNEVWIEKVDSIETHSGEDPMKMFARVDLVVDTVATLGIAKAEEDIKTSNN